MSCSNLKSVWKIRPWLVLHSSRRRRCTISRRWTRCNTSAASRCSSLLLASCMRRRRCTASLWRQPLAARWTISSQTFTPASRGQHRSMGQYHARNYHCRVLQSGVILRNVIADVWRSISALQITLLVSRGWSLPHKCDYWYPGPGIRVTNDITHIQGLVSALQLRLLVSRGQCLPYKLHYWYPAVGIYRTIAIIGIQGMMSALQMTLLVSRGLLH